MPCDGTYACGTCELLPDQIFTLKGDIGDDVKRDRFYYVDGLQISSHYPLFRYKICSKNVGKKSKKVHV